MRLGKKLVSAIVVLTMSTTALTGCTSSKKAISETVENFLEVIESGSSENIEQYASRNSWLRAGVLPAGERHTAVGENHSLRRDKSCSTIKPYKPYEYKKNLSRIRVNYQQRRFMLPPAPEA